MSNKRKEIDGYSLGSNKKCKSSTINDELVRITLDHSLSDMFLKKKFETITKSTLRWIKNKETINTQFIPIEFSNDYEYVKKAVTKNGQVIKYASEELRNNKELATIAFIDHNVIDFESNLQNDEEFLMELLKKTPDGSSFQFASSQLQMNSEFALKCLKENGYVMKFIRARLKTIEFFKQAVYQGGNNVEYVTGFAMGYYPELKNDREFIHKAIGFCGVLLEHANEEFKNDREIVYQAIQNEEFAFKYASNEIKQDYEFILRCVPVRAGILEFVNPILKYNKEFMLKCIKLNGKSVEYFIGKDENDELTNCALTEHGFLVQSNYSNNLLNLRIENEYPELLNSNFLNQFTKKF